MAFETPRPGAPVTKQILLRKYSLWGGTSRGRRNLELRQLTGKKRVFREFRLGAALAPINRDRDEVSLKIS
jgi:hypothetical protein